MSSEAMTNQKLLEEVKVRNYQCALKFHFMCGGVNTEEQGHDMNINDIIVQIAYHTAGSYDDVRYEAYRILLYGPHVPIEALHQQILCQLAAEMGEKEKQELTNLLLGQNNEYLIEGDCLFTDELFDKAYETIVCTHMDLYRLGCFKTEDLDEECLARHLDYLEYAKQNNL
jgi:hypothetical protein